MNAAPSQRPAATTSPREAASSRCWRRRRAAPERDVSAPEHEHPARALVAGSSTPTPSSGVRCPRPTSRTSSTTPRGRYAVSPWPGAEHPIVTGATEARCRRNRRVTGPRSTARGLELVEHPEREPQRPAGALGDLDGSRPCSSPAWITGYLHPGYPRLKTAGNYPACVASEYLNGRAVYFQFCPVDLPHDATWGSAAGPDAYVAGALHRVGDRVGRAEGRPLRDGSCAADAPVAEIDVYSDGIYTCQFVGNIGNVSCVGPVTTRIYDPSGKLRSSASHYPAGYIGARARRQGVPDLLHVLRARQPRERLVPRRGQVPVQLPGA